MPQIPSFLLDLSQFAESERFEVFREAASVTHEVSRQASFTSDFQAVTESWNLGNIIVNRSQFAGCHFDRSSRRLSSDGIDHYTLLYLMKGSSYGQIDGAELRVSAGQLFVLDLGQPAAFEVTSTENVFISVPRDLLDAISPVGNVHGRVLTGPSGALLAGFIQLLLENIKKLSAHEAARAECALVNLLAACLAPSRDAAEVARPAIDATLLQRSRIYIEKNLKDPGLSTESICYAVGISRSTLYRLFEPSGGVSAYIQNRRLLRIRKALANPLSAERISDVAYTWGFSNPEHFSKAFRRAFGQTPREVKRNAQLTSLKPTATQLEYHSWLRGDSIDS